MSREELEAMLGLSALKHTRIYQEARQEGLQEGRQEGKLETKLEMVRKLQQRGFSVEEIADLLELDLEIIR